jgi:hypothetical protein
MHEPRTGNRTEHRILTDRLVLKPGGCYPPGFVLLAYKSPFAISIALLTP